MIFNDIVFGLTNSSMASNNNVIEDQLDKAVDATIDGTLEEGETEEVADELCKAPESAT